MGDKVSGGTVTEKPQLLDWLAEQAESADLSGLGDVEVSWYFRAVHPDLRSRDGFRYPWPGRWAEAPGPLLEHKGACPKSPGDGLCVAKDFNGAGSGGIRLGMLLLVGANADDVLGQDDHKLRVKRMYVADLIDIRTVLGGADLRGAYLGGAYLGGADLGGAYLGGAYLRGAYLRDADLRDAYLRGADLRGADLRDAVHSQLTLWPAGFDPVAAGAVKL